MKCKSCNGNGLSNCTHCSGEGFDYGQHKCEVCSGDGKVACSSCGGNGKTSLIQRLKKEKVI